MSELIADLEALAALALPDGGWGYAPNQGAHLEPTCLCCWLWARRAGASQERHRRRQMFLQKCAVGRRTYRIERGRDEAVWPTSMVLFTLAAARRRHPRRTKAASASVLLGLQGKHTHDESDQEIHDIDLTIVGWPWSRRQFLLGGADSVGVRGSTSRRLRRTRPRQGRHQAAHRPRARRRRHQLRKSPHPRPYPRTGFPGPTALITAGGARASRASALRRCGRGVPRRQGMAGDDLRTPRLGRNSPLIIYSDRPGVQEKLTQIDKPHRGSASGA